MVDSETPVSKKTPHNKMHTERWNHDCPGYIRRAAKAPRQHVETQSPRLSLVVLYKGLRWTCSELPAMCSQRLTIWGNNMVFVLSNAGGKNPQKPSVLAWCDSFTQHRKSKKLRSLGLGLGPGRTVFHDYRMYLRRRNYI